MGDKVLVNYYSCHLIFFLLSLQFFQPLLYSMDAEAKSFYGIVAVVSGIWIGRNIWRRHQKAKAHQVELELRVEQLERQIKFCYSKKFSDESETAINGIGFDPESYITKDFFMITMQTLNQKIFEFASEIDRVNHCMRTKLALLEERSNDQKKTINSVESKFCLRNGDLSRLSNIIEPLDSRVRSNELIIKIGLERTENQIKELWNIYENSVELYKKHISNVHATMQQIVCTLNEKLPKENKLNNLEIKALVDAPFIKLKEDLDSQTDSSLGKGKGRLEGCCIQ